MATSIDDNSALVFDIKNNSVNEEYLSVPEFYNGRSIFITGGTGFMGKVCNLCRNNTVLSILYTVRLIRGTKVSKIYFLRYLFSCVSSLGVKK